MGAVLKGQGPELKPVYWRLEVGPRCGRKLNLKVGSGSGGGEGGRRLGIKAGPADRKSVV